MTVKSFLLTAVCGLATAWLCGCATARVVPDASEIQGTWKGQEVRNGQATDCTLTLFGTEAEFHGRNGEWYRGTYTLNENASPKQLIVTILHAGKAQYEGKTANAIYALTPGQEQEQDSLVISGNEPGDPRMPASFSDTRARQVVFSRQ